MKKYLKKLLSIFLVISLSFLPISNLPIIHAANIWTKLTDDTFSSNYYYLYYSVTFNDYFIFSASNGSNIALYSYNGTNVSQLSADRFGDENNSGIGGLVVVNNVLYVASQYNSVGGGQVYAYDGDTFTNVTDSFTANTPDGTGSIFSLANYNNNLVAMVSRNNIVQIYQFDANSTSWTQINTNNFGTETIDYPVANGLIEFNNKLYARLISNDTSVVMVYDGETWQVAGTNIGEAYYPIRFAVYNSNLYLSSGQSVYEYQSGTNWINIGDSTLSDAVGSNYLESLHVFNGDLYTGTSGTAPATILKYNGSEWKVVSNIAGDSSQAFVMNIDDYLGKLMVSTALPGEGPYSASLWSFVESTDADEDGINNSVEDLAPNSGDANNDGTLDSNQANVTSFINSVTSNYAVLQSSCTTNNSATIAPESDNTASDSGFSYPVGLMNFTLTCSTPGATETVTMYYYGNYNAELMIARKYNSTTHLYTTIPGAIITNVTIGGQSALKIVYSIKDGGSLDADGLENGIIVDPAGPALNSASVPNTGIGRMGR